MSEIEKKKQRMLQQRLKRREESDKKRQLLEAERQKKREEQQYVLPILFYSILGRIFVHIITWCTVAGNLIHVIFSFSSSVYSIEMTPVLTHLPYELEGTSINDDSDFHHVFKENASFNSH